MTQLLAAADALREIDRLRTLIEASKLINSVSGKGVSAALIMSSLQAAVRLAAPMQPDLVHLVESLNVLLHQMTGGRKFVTFFVGRYRPETGELRYVNAGHNPPLLAENGSCRLLASTGRPIGILPDGTYGEATATVARGGTLLLYTDGLVEAVDEEEKEFGTARLVAAIAGRSTQPPSEVLDGLRADVTRFENGKPPKDDTTLVVLRRT